MLVYCGYQKLSDVHEFDGSVPPSEMHRNVSVRYWVVLEEELVMSRRRRVR
jgi:hypothetical protein